MTTGAQTTKKPTSTVSLAGCIKAPVGIVKAIEAGLNGKGGTTITSAAAVRSRGTFPSAPAQIRNHLYFVGARVKGTKGQFGVAVWVTSNLNGKALIYPASGLANDVTTFKSIGGATSKPIAEGFGISASSPGYRKVGTCVEHAPNK